MRKLTANELMRNGVYAKIGELEIDGFDAKGNVKQGFLFKDEEGNSMVIKVILKKDEVDYEEEATDRPTEQVKDEEEDTAEEAEDATEEEA